jgi:ATP-dependent DNA helicase RecG
MPTRKKPESANKKAASPEARFAKLGIVRDADAVLHLPLRYDDYTSLSPMREVRPGMTTGIEGEVTLSEVRLRPRRQLLAQVRDGLFAVTLRFFTYFPNTREALTPGKRVRAFGEVRNGHFGLEMVHPKITSLLPAQTKPLAERLSPVYPTTAGLTQETLARRVRSAMNRDEATMTDVLPPAVVAKEGLWDWRQAITFLHAPPPHLSEEERRQLDDRTHPAWQRVKFDELLAQQLSLKLHRKHRAASKAAPLPADARDDLTAALLARLPFQLTGAQQRVWQEIAADLARDHPMNRLLQGDVGSGKTVIAALAALRAIERGKQVAIMAPTEILAEQHYRKLSAWLADLPVTLVWLTGSMTASAKAKAHAALATDAPLIAIGTHALFQSDVGLPNLGLAIVDEQHRFGVAQRLKLREKGSAARPLEVHQLMMSATPIPRTLAMSFYADLDVSVIDELPPGRTPVETRLVNQSRRDTIIAHVGKRCAAGGQAYWVCPLVEESEKLSLQAAETLFEELKLAYSGDTPDLPMLNVGLLHGKLKAPDKAAVMHAFEHGEIDVLVATTVIEVGVDVPNASIMVIEHAERFGLSQLHQLRGRVGRGSAMSQCILLFEDPLTMLAKERLKTIYRSADGFEIAGEDLRLRGPGELLGARQAGVPMLRYANLDEDLVLLEHASTLANRALGSPHGEAIAEKLMERWLGGKAEFFKV